jgi:folate-binding protein YgfZ
MREALQLYDTVCENYGIFLQNNPGVIRMSGDNCIEFLQRLSTNNVLSLQLNDACTTILTNEKGRIIDIVTVFSIPSSFLILTSENSAANVLQWLEKFIILENIQLQDVSEQYYSIYVCGKKNSEFLQSFYSANSDHFKMISEMASHQAVSIKHCLLHISSFHQHNLSFSPEWLFEIIRIENGIPLFGKEITIEYNPFECGLQNYISFSKGCYIGQEIIARLDAYHKVQKQLCGFNFANHNPENSDKKIYSESKKIGFVTSSVFSSKKNEWLALGYRDTKQKIGTSAYSLLHSGEKIDVSICPLPFDVKNEK